MPKLRLVKLFAAVMGAALLAPLPAAAAPAGPTVGPFIEPPPAYDGQTKCSPWAKPGVVAFQRLVLAAYPGTGEGSIGRECHVGGQSEHKEGRAWDWGVNVGVPAERAAAEDLLDWLAAPDAFGNRAAMARRAGIMYLIWNKRIWFPGSGWRIYCVQRGGACVDPEDGGARHPHTDHVHFSFTRAGAFKKTTFWNEDRTFAAEAATEPDGGVWVAGRNGGLRGYGGAGFYGSLSDARLKSAIVAIDGTPAGDGYLMVSRKGSVFAHGAAKHRGSPQGAVASDLAVTPTGKGYWVLGREGRVFEFGDAAELGDAPLDGGATIALVPTPSGAGYWVLSESGAVFAFGDAQHHGDVEEPAIDMAATPSGGGYWIASSTGQVRSFGDAQEIAAGPVADVVSIAPTSTGGGFWLVDSYANLHPFGDATELRLTSNGSFAADVQGAVTQISE